MDEGMLKLQQDLVQVEHEAEHLLLARKELVDCDKARNGNREALTALRKLAQTSRSSVPVTHEFADLPQTDMDPASCKTCGEYDGSESTWLMCPGADIFVNISFHEVHSKLEKEQEQLEVTVNKLRSTVKEKALYLSDKGVLADKIGPNLLRALVNLKDNH